MESTIQHTSQIVSIVWTVLLIILILYFLYTLYNNSNQTPARDLLGSPGHHPAGSAHPDQRGKRQRNRDDTSLVEHPEYELHPTDVSELDVAQMGIKEFDHNDLRKLIADPEWLKGYVKVLNRSLQSKLKYYEGLAAKAEDDYATVFEQNPDQRAVSVELQKAKTLRESLRSVIADIEARLATLTIDIVERDFRQIFNHPKYGLDNIVGQKPHKDFIARMIYTFSQDPDVFFNDFLNIIMMGPSGIGKNAMSTALAFSFGKSGILARYKFTRITKKDLANEFVNNSARTTWKLLINHIEGVVFHDEAYDLLPNAGGFGRQYDHGEEAAREIVATLDHDDFRGRIIYIAAGYETQMRRGFIESNDGMRRRFPHHIVLQPYSTEELAHILVRCIYDKTRITLSKHEANVLYSELLIEIAKNPKVYKTHAGDMFNMAGTIAKTIRGTPKIKWGTDQKSNTLLLRLGFKRFMEDLASGKPDE